MCFKYTLGKIELITIGILIMNAINIWNKIKIVLPLG